MIKKFLLIIIAVVFVAAACAVPVHAADLGDYSDGWEQTGINNSVHNLIESWRILQKVKKNEISVPEAAAQIVGMGWSGTFDNICNFVNELITTGDIEVMTPLEFVTAVGNAINSEISNNGGNISNFPLNDGGYWKIGNFTFKPLNLAEVNDCISANVSPLGPWSSQKQPCSGVVAFWPDGTRYKNSTMFRVFGDVGTSQSLTINNIEVLFNNTVDVVIHYSIRYINKGASYTFNGNDTIKFDYSVWGDYTEDDLFQITEAPDLGQLTDDELEKYIDNAIKKLEETFPDLSTIEGKLQEIINLLNKSKNGECSCDEMAAAVRELISRLDVGTDSELNNTLKELTKILDNNQDLTSVIDKIDELQKELLKAYAFNYSNDDVKAVTDKYDEFADYLIKKKFSFVTSLTQIINSALNTYAKSNATSFNVTYKGITREVQLDSGFSYDQLQLIRYMLAAFIYIRFAFSCYRRIPAYINNGGDK